MTTPDSPAETRRTPKERGPHVLVVEDVTDLQMLLARLLTRGGFRVSRASNGLEALNWLQAQEELPDLILLDIMMPVMDGFEFREAQRQDARLSGIPVVVMTAYSDPQSMADKMGVTQILKKPISMETLLKATEAWI